MEKSNFKVGIFGGTFDPIHRGHLKTAEQLVKMRNLDKLIFVPCNISPHKIDKKTCQSDHRLNMVKLSIKNFEHFDYSDYEILKGEVSYTLDTLQHFSKLYEQIELIIGFDNIISFNTWYKPDEIVKIANLVVMRRTIDSDPNHKNKYFEIANFVDTPIIDISATEVRIKVDQGISISDLVLPEVEEYIIKNNLYQE